MVFSHPLAPSCKTRLSRSARVYLLAGAFILSPAALAQQSPAPADAEPNSFEETVEKTAERIAERAALPEAADTGAPPLPEGAWPIQEEAKQRLRVTVDDAYIELHTGPGRGYPVFHVVEQGELIELHKRRTDWIKIGTRRGKTGWVRRADLNHTLGPDGKNLDFSDPGLEDYAARRWDMGVLVGDFDGADSLGVHVGYRFAKNLSAELKLTQATGTFADSRVAALALLHQPFPAWRVSPFFSLGAGIIDTQPAATLVRTEDRRDTDIMAGVGALVYISRRFVLRVEYNNHKILTSRDQNEEVNEWKVGLNVFF